MSRTARVTSITGFYHVMTRGVGNQTIFEDDWDRLFYLKLLKEYSVEAGIEICVYCLMDNHVHLLVYDSDMNLSLFMKKLGVSYVAYYNKKYNRRGHLFQDRFKSKAIEDETYLLVLFRYILNNPVKAGLSKSADYSWSSYWDYKHGNGISVSKYILGMMDYSQIDDYLCVDEEIGTEYSLEETGGKITDKVAAEIAAKIINNNNLAVLQSYSREECKRIIRQLKREGLSIRQISKLTGIGRGFIQRV